MSKSLPQVLGRLEATTVVVGSMIGSGVFLKVKSMSGLLPHPGLILLCWLLAGLLTLSGALVIAELSARFPGSGGLYLFLRQGLGPRVAFLFGWSLLTILQSGSIAGLACGMAQTLAPLLKLSALGQQILAFTSIAFITGLHCVSVSVGTRWLQNGLTMIKYAGILLLIGLGMLSGKGEASHLAGQGELPGLGLMLSAMGVIMLKALWAYDGWANATFIAGEVKEAERNLPLALIQGTLLVMAAYLAINGAYHWVLPVGVLASADSPPVTLTETCLGPGWSHAVGSLLALSMLGTLNSSVLSAPRVYFAMALRGQFPAWMAATNRFQTPYVSLIVQGVWACVLVLFWKNFETITDNVTFTYWIFYALTVIAALRFPAPETGYRAPARPLLAAAFLSGATLLVVSQLLRAPSASLQALVLLVVGLLFYRPGTDEEAT